MLAMLLSALLLGACSDLMVKTPQELEKYVQKEDNGLKKANTIGDVSLSMAYRPTSLLINQTLSAAPTPQEVDSLKQIFEKNLYFALSLSGAGKEIETYKIANGAAFGERIQTLAFGMGQMLTIMNEKQDTLPLVDYFYQRTFGVGKSSDFLLVLDRDKVMQGKECNFLLREFGLGIGNQSFKFSTSDIDKTPEIHLLK